MLKDYYYTQVFPQASEHAKAEDQAQEAKK
jgi:hypothetical protein